MNRPMELTNFHLERAKKNALRARAKANGSKLADEIRSAVDAYLGGGTREELALMGQATQRAEADIREMIAALEATNRKALAVFAELDRLQRTRS
jgi:hypothetical protein